MYNVIPYEKNVEKHLSSLCMIVVYRSRNLYPIRKIIGNMILDFENIKDALQGHHCMLFGALYILVLLIAKLSQHR